MKRKFRYLPHTADIAFVAYGKTFGEAIENAALAMFCVMFDAKKLERLDAKERRFIITESAKSREDLVWFTLQNILSRIQVGNLSPTRFHVSSLKEKAGTFSAEGTLVCKHADSSVYGLLEVKAVTPHELAVKKEKDGFSVKAVVDI